MIAAGYITGREAVRLSCPGQLISIIIAGLGYFIGPRRGSFVRDNELSLFFGLHLPIGPARAGLTGWAAYNNEQIADGLATVSLLGYLAPASFGVDVAQNWQSEYLQFLLYIWATVWLVQRGSPESKKEGTEGAESDKEQKAGSSTDAGSPGWAKAGGVRTRVFSSSLVLVMGAVFVGSWFAQSVAGVAAYNEGQIVRLEDPASWIQYVWSAEFWNRTLQNWQSEFLAVGSTAIFSVFLRQRGSPESKPVGEAHTTTGATG